MVIGNAVTQLNDRGFQFKVLPPSILTEDQCTRWNRTQKLPFCRLKRPQVPCISISRCVTMRAASASARPWLWARKNRSHKAILPAGRPCDIRSRGEIAPLLEISSE